MILPFSAWEENGRERRPNQEKNISILLFSVTAEGFGKIFEI
jgi:hypothetical protein